VLRCIFRWSHSRSTWRRGRPRCLNRALRAKYIQPSALDGIDRAWGALDDVAIELAPRRWRSWTGSVLQAETSKQLDMPYEDVWIPTDG